MAMIRGDDWIGSEFLQILLKRPWERSGSTNLANYLEMQGQRDDAEEIRKHAGSWWVLANGARTQQSRRGAIRGLRQVRHKILDTIDDLPF